MTKTLVLGVKVLEWGRMRVHVMLKSVMIAYASCPSANRSSHALSPSTSLVETWVCGLQLTRVAECWTKPLHLSVVFLSLPHSYNAQVPEEVGWLSTIECVFSSIIGAYGWYNALDTDEISGAFPTALTNLPLPTPNTKWIVDRTATCIYEAGHTTDR